jgi:hypothetical protein
VCYVTECATSSVLKTQITVILLWSDQYTVFGRVLDFELNAYMKNGKSASNVKETSNTQVQTGTYKEADAVPPFAASGLSGNTDWRRKWERLKH